MSPAAIIAIAVAVVVVLAAVVLVTAAAPRATSRGDRRALRARRASATRHAEHRPADEARRPAARSSAPPSSSARGAELVAADAVDAGRRACRPTPRPSASAAGSSSTAASSSLIGARPRALRRRRFVAFLWPTAKGGFGGKINVGKIDDIIAEHQRRQRLLLHRRGPHVDHRSTRPTRSTRPRQCLLRSRCSPAWRHGIVVALPEVPAPRLPRAAVRQHRSGSSARATARSTTRSARRRAARRRVAWTASPSRSSPAATSSSTPAPSSRARRSAPTPPAKRLKARTASVAEVATDDRSLAHRPRSAGVILVVSLSSAGSSTSSSTATRRGRSSARRSSWRPTASRTTTTRSSRARGSTARAARRRAAARRRSSSACRSTGCSSPAGRPAPSSGYGQHVRRLGRATVRDRPPNGGFNCAGCHGGMKATGGSAPYTRHRPDDRRGHSRSTGTRRRSTPCCYRFSRRRGALHPHLRPAVLADVGVGRRRRRPDERPADRDAHRLPRSIQLPPESCLRAGQPRR